jgi:tetratricopeptide (TPR) repeat protein
MRGGQFCCWALGLALAGVDVEADPVALEISALAAQLLEHARQPGGAAPSAVGDAHYSLAQLYRDARGDRTAAERHLRDALSANPSHADAHNDLGLLQMDQVRPPISLGPHSHG